MRPACRSTPIHRSNGANLGVLSAFDARTGKPHYQLQRLDGVPNVFASPALVDNEIYLRGHKYLYIAAW